MKILFEQVKLEVLIPTSLSVCVDVEENAFVKFQRWIKCLATSRAALP